MEIDDLAAFDAAVYGMPHQGTVSYVQEQFSRGWENLTEKGKSFFEERRAMMEEATSESSLMRTEALARKFRHMWDTDDVKIVNDLGGLQQAQPAMQRWLMADPVMRKLNDQNLIDGYADTYKDWEPGKSGEDQYDFRRATDGIYMDGEDEGCTTFHELHVNEEDELTFQQQTDIQCSWLTQRTLIKRRREDTTSSRNDRM